MLRIASLYTVGYIWTSGIRASSKSSSWYCTCVRVRRRSQCVDAYVHVGPTRTSVCLIFFSGLNPSCVIDSALYVAVCEKYSCFIWCGVFEMVSHVFAYLFGCRAMP